MKTRIFLFGMLLVSTLALSACAAPLLGLIPVRSETTYESEELPIEVVETLPIDSGADVPEGVTEEPASQPVFSFNAAEFVDEDAGVKLYHPADWTVLPREQVGDRGSQAALLSPGSTLEQVTEGGSRITLVLYKWDPKNDLTAFVAQRELAWEASGFEFNRQENFLLEDGREVVWFQVMVGDDSKVLFAFTTAGEDYLQVAGEGDLELIEEILLSLSSDS